jgi:mannitol 2-dehydrogenase
MKLNKSTLAQISIDTPSYNRDEIGIGIVHFGVGGFHRAHQAMYVDRLLEMGLAKDWGICGVGVLPADRKMADAMAAQDCLYTLLLEKPDGGREARVIGSIVDYRYAPDDPEAVIELLAAPSTRIISLTITEGGYNIDNLGNGGIAGSAGGGGIAGSAGGGINVFGLVADALARRRDRGIPSPTIVSCDNIEGNGEVARQAFTTYAERVHPGLGEWMSANTRFPNSMVDRITPVTTPEVIAALRDEFGVQDQWPVAAEPFTSWVLEDDFSDGRPPLEQADVLLVDDVTPYELMKLRLLNASHQSLCYFAYLAGYRLVHDAAGDPLFAEFLLQYMDSEATPTLKPVPGIDLPNYKRTLIERFANPGVKDTIVRLCFGSSDRIPKWLLPVVRANLASGGPVRLSAATVASWARYDEGVDEDGEPIDVQDQLADTLVPLARSQHEHPTAFIENTEVFGDLASQPRFVEAYLWALDSLHRDGARATLETLLRKETT